MISDVEMSKMGKWRFFGWVALYILLSPIRWIYPYIPVVMSRSRYDRLTNDLAVRENVIRYYEGLIKKHELQGHDRQDLKDFHPIDFQ